MDKVEQMIEQIKAIAADTNKSVNQRVDEIITLHQSLDQYSHEAFQTGVAAYESARTLLLNDNYEDCHMMDLLMCDALLAKAYMHDQRSWLIAPLAQHAYDMMLGVSTDDEESLKTMIAVIDRLCSVINSDHPRLLMKLYAMQYSFEKQRNEPNTDALKDTTEQLVSLATLSACDTWYAPLKEEIEALLGKDAVKEIEQNPYTGHLKKDPIEYSEEYEAVIDKVEEEVSNKMGNQPYAMGMCFEIWHIKQTILAEKYGIEWRTPSQMNPRVMFD